jgi:hypothetical protein
VLIDGNGIELNYVDDCNETLDNNRSSAHIPFVDHGKLLNLFYNTTIKIQCFGRFNLVV